MAGVGVKEGGDRDGWRVVKREVIGMKKGKGGNRGRKVEVEVHEKDG